MYVAAKVLSLDIYDLSHRTLEMSLYVCFKDKYYYEIRRWDAYLADREARCSSSTPSNSS